MVWFPFGSVSSVVMERARISLSDTVMPFS
jgi:hypothetical protein